MESYSIISKYESYSIPIQIIKLKDSFFIYVGTSGFNFDNLIISSFSSNEIPSKSANCYTVFEDEYSEIGKSLSNKLSKIILLTR
jgi:hypothetical protein